MEVKNIVFILVFIGAFGFLYKNLAKVFSYLKVGQDDDRFKNVGERVKNVIIIVFGQSKLFREPVAGIVHFLLFWGFVLFLFAVVEAIIQGFYSPFTFEFLGPIFSFITITQDVFGALVFFLNSCRLV
jgi:hypothetical protein